MVELKLNASAEQGNSPAYSLLGYFLLYGFHFDLQSLLLLLALVDTIPKLRSISTNVSIIVP